MIIGNSVTRIFACMLVFMLTSLFACKKETSQSGNAAENNFSIIAFTSNIEISTAFDDVFYNVLGVNDEVAFGETGVFARNITIDSLSNQCFTAMGAIYRLYPAALACL